MERSNLQITLGFSKGSSDKLYKVHLHEVDTKWRVFALYGKRHNVTNHTTIIDDVSYNEAYEHYEKTIQKKLKKGYQVER